MDMRQRIRDIVFLLTLLFSVLAIVQARQEPLTECEHPNAAYYRGFVCEPSA